jgi:hypothetical protein
MKRKRLNSQIPRISKLWGWLQDNQLLIIILLAFIVRVVAVVVMDLWKGVGFDAIAGGKEFAKLARNMVGGNGFSYYEVDGQLLPSAYLPPAYAFWMAFVFWVFGEGASGFLVLQAINILFGTLSCVALLKLADLVFPRPVGFISALFMAVYPSLVYAVVRPHSAAMYIWVNLLVIWFLLRASKHAALGQIGLAGLFAGILALFRSEMVMFLPFLALWLFLKLDKGRRWQGALLFILIAVLVFSPWTLRNYLVFDAFVPVQSAAGYNFSRGHNPDATGSGRTFAGEGIDAASGMPDVQAQVRALPPSDDWEVRRDSIYMRAAWGYILSHPWETAKVTLMKFLFFVGMDVTHPESSSPLYWLPWAVILPLFVLGLIRGIKQRVDISLFVAYLVFYTLIEMAFFVIPRHRLFIVPLVILLSAYGIYCLVEGWTKKRDGLRFSGSAI